MASMTEEMNSPFYFIFINLNLKIHMQLVYTIKQLRFRLWFLLGLLSFLLSISTIVPGTYKKQVPLIMFIELVSK